MAGMLEQTFDQASGLHALKILPAVRVLPVISSAEGSDSLELLWRLERALTCLGFTVEVVEGARGLRVHDAAAGAVQVMSRWVQGVHPGSVVLVHAPLEVFAALLTDSEARPLVALGEQPRSLVEAYNAVKVLSQVAGLRPVVLDLAGASPSGQVAGSRVASALRHSCERHLTQVPAIWSLGYDHSMNACLDHSEESCVLKVLDTALLLEDPESCIHVHSPHQSRPSPAADPIIGVPDVHRQRHA